MTEALDVGFKNGCIRLEEIPNVYYSGQTLNGSVIFDLREPLQFSALYVQFLGEANVLWSESEIDVYNGHEQERLVKYQGHEEYFNYTEALAGGIGTSELPRTYQKFPFKFQIPFNAPSSFEGERGSVSYTITATMVYPDMSKDEIKKEFTVVDPLDLNNGSPSIKEPIDLEFEEVYGCNCFCSSSPISIRVRLPVAGYCPGQAIPVAIEVDNDSSVEITRMKFEILTRGLYRSQQPASEYIPPEKVLTATKRGAVMAHSKRNFTCNVTVPDMIAPNLEKCTIIDVGYFFRITIKLSGCNDELQDEAEICLGLVPLTETLTAEYKHPMAHSLPSGPIPINNTPELIIPPTTGFTGSNISINRSQNNSVHNAPYINYPGSNSLHNSHQNISQISPNQSYPPPYPGNMPYGPAPGFGSNRSINRSGFGSNRSINRSQDNPPPYPGIAPYPNAVGFNPHYPGNTMTNVPPYPTGNVMPGVGSPYPTNNEGMPNLQGGFAPSAPPAGL